MKRNKFSAPCVVDTNVPITANCLIHPETIPKEMYSCVFTCVEAIEDVMKSGEMVIDDGNEIFDEYLNHLDLSGKQGVGNAFVKWVHDYRWGFSEENRVAIHPDGKGSFQEFPTHAGLAAFDLSDRKFIAVANAHCQSPIILQATDSKWWGWKEALAEKGIIVKFLCQEYVKNHYEKKFSSDG